MRRTAVALAVAAILVMAVSGPASAMSWFQLRLSPATGNWTGDFSDLPYNMTTTMLGLTGFIQFPNTRFGIRANLDTGSLSSWTPLTFYDGGSWRYYDIDLAFPLTLGTGKVLLFAGYGNNNWQATLGGALISQQLTSGFVFGADVMWPLGSSGRWYLTGSATIGPSNQFLYCNPTPGFPCNTTTFRASGTANVGVYSAGLGWNLPNGMSSLEVGWRSGSFKANAINSGDINALNSNPTWSGVYLGLTVRH
jgi:hypothetical protein